MYDDVLEYAYAEWHRLKKEIDDAMKECDDSIKHLDKMIDSLKKEKEKSV